MTWDILLEWMTHMGSGTWGTFREAIRSASSETEGGPQHETARMLRVTLSDLGHADFFVDGSRKWRALRPALLGLEDGTRHVFAGGRTRVLAERLIEGAERAGASATSTRSDAGPSVILLEGDPEVLRENAESLGVEYVPNAGFLLASRLPSLGDMLGAAAVRSEPINWEVRSWSFDEVAWVPSRLRHTAREYRNRFGHRRYVVEDSRGRLRELDKRVAIYAAAMTRGLRIARYDGCGRLAVPRWAPLPEVYSRAACLAGGRLAEVRGQDLVYQSVGAGVASFVLTGLAQGYPALGAHQ